jgi:hypothetical protein
MVARSGGGAARSAGEGRAFGVTPPALQAGRFRYTRTVGSLREWMPAGGTSIDRRGYTHRHGPEVLFDLRVSDETWIGADGTIRERKIVAGVRFASAAGRREWERYGRPVPDFNDIWLGWAPHDSIVVGGREFPAETWGTSWGEWLGPFGWDVGDGLFTYRELVSLPTRPAALRARLRRAEQALARREARISRHGAVGAGTDAFGQLGDIAGLEISPVPVPVRLALLHVAATIPGVSVTELARDSLGRAGVAVSASAGPGFERLIFDRATGELLEEAPNVAVIAQGEVDSAYSLPRGVRPVRAHGAPPQPLRPAISPTVGKATTIFEVTLSSRAGRWAGRPPALDWMLIGTPGPRCFAGFLPQLPPLEPSARVELAGKVTYLYRLAPSSARRGSWCPGRYELGVLPESSRRSRAPQPSPNLSPGLSSSIFFQVR